MTSYLFWRGLFRALRPLLRYLQVSGQEERKIRTHTITQKHATRCSVILFSLIQSCVVLLACFICSYKKKNVSFCKPAFGAFLHLNVTWPDGSHETAWNIFVKLVGSGCLLVWNKGITFGYNTILLCFTGTDDIISSLYITITLLTTIDRAVNSMHMVTRLCESIKNGNKQSDYWKWCKLAA